MMRFVRFQYIHVHQQYLAKINLKKLTSLDTNHNLLTYYNHMR